MQIYKKYNIIFYMLTH